MRIVENSANRLVLRHSPWATSGLCVGGFAGSLWTVVAKFPALKTSDLVMLPVVIAMCCGCIWFFARWSNYTFDRRTGTLIVEERILPFFQPGVRTKTIPIKAIERIELQTYFDDIMMWRAAVIADPKKLLPDPLPMRQQRAKLRKMHFHIPAEGVFPLVPYYTSNKNVWVKIEDAVSCWLGLRGPAVPV